MANEYGELEQLVNDVTSLDTARMTLRWALERLNTIEKEKADLKKNLTLAEEAAKKLQLKDSSLQEAYNSRSKTLEEKEDFYTKLEATMSLLGEGKLDIQQLLKKEAKLDGLRRNLEDEYQSKFEELDRNQRAVIERWNGRLLEVENQYAGQLAEAQKKYDALRAGLEADYQGRLAALQASFKAREKELGARIEGLEGSVRSSEEKIETRRRELEAEYLNKKHEADENYRKLKGMLEAGLEDKLRAMDSDHAAQVRSLETSWQTERARLLEEQRVREEQFSSAQARIKEIENQLAAQQESHHNELLKVITEKETAFRAQIASLEKEKGLKEAAVRELMVKLETRSTDWAAERAALESEFGRRIAEVEASARERVEKLEREHGERRAAMEKALEDKQRELAEAAERHGRELLERVQDGEAAFRQKLEAFEAEKRAYNETIARMSAAVEEAARAAETEKENFRKELARISEQAEAMAEERNASVRADYEARKADLEKDFSARYADRLKAVEAERSRLDEALAEREKQLDAAFAESRRLDAALADLRMKAAEEKAALSRDYEGKMNGALKAVEDAAKAREAELAADLEVLRGELAGRDRQLAQEKARLVDELSKASIEAHNRGEARAEAVKAEYAGKLASLEAAAEAREEELRQAIAAKEGLLEKALSARENSEKAMQAAFELEKASWGEERGRLELEFNKRLSEAETGFSERATAIRAEYEARKADLEKDFAARYADRLKALEAERSRLDEALAERGEQLNAAFAEARALSSALADLRMKAAEEKAALSRDYEGKMNGALKAAEDAAKAREAELAADLEVLRGELAGRDRQLAQEKARLVDELSKASIEAHNRGEARAETVRSEYEAKLASLESAAEARVNELKEAIAGKAAELDASYAAREAAEKALKDSFDAEKAGWISERTRLEKEFDKRVEELEAGLSERAASIRAEYEARKADLEKDFAARYADRLKALETEKSRLNEALGEREKQLDAAFAEARGLNASLAALRAAASQEKADLVRRHEKEFSAAMNGAMEVSKVRETQLRSELADLRMKAAEEKAALSRDYEGKMNGALKAVEDAAKAREAELAADLEVLRGELAGRDRQLAQEKARLVDELSKASIEAHNRGEARAEAVKAEYAGKLASLEAAAEAREEELKRSIAVKEALLEKALKERADTEAAIKAEFERKRSELEEAMAARAAEMEKDYAAHKERMVAELAEKTAAVHKEAAVKSDIERANWGAERTRLERTLGETSYNFRSAQKEIEDLNKKLRAAEESNSARETAMSRELMEAKANYEKELAYRVKDAVTIQTSHLVEALEASKARQEELHNTIEAKDEAIRRLKSEGEEARRVYENRILDAGSGALKERREELERHYAAKSAALEEEMASFRHIMESENESLRAAMEQAREEVLAANKRADDTFNDMLKASKAVQEEKLEINRLRTEEFNAAVSEAVNKAVESTAQKLRHTEAELVRVQGLNRDEVKLLTEAFNKEKDRMLEEIVRRENYLESADLKIQELEQQVNAMRQNSSLELMKHVGESEKRFREMVADEKARYEARVKQLEDLLGAKERLLADSEKIYRQKQLELDAMHAELNASVARFNDELFAQKQALGGREKELNDFRLRLEKDYAAKASDLEKMRTELAHAIMEYKNRK